MTEPENAESSGGEQPPPRPPALSGGEDTPDRPGLEKTKPASVSEAHLKTVLESLIFVSNQPVTDRKLARVAKSPVAVVRTLLKQLLEEYQGRGIELVEVGSGYQFRSAVANAPFVRDIVAKRPVRLTRAQLETLAISAYRQPLTKPELEDIRGVDSSSTLKVLLERGLLKILGRKEEPGRPLLYGTAPYFLEFFGLKSLDGLPTLKEFSELSEDSKTLYARRTGEDIESIGDIEIPPSEWDDDDDPEEGEDEIEQDETERTPAPADGEGGFDEDE